MVQHHESAQPRLFRARNLTMAALDDLHEKNKVRRLDGPSATATAGSTTVGSSFALDEAMQMPRSVSAFSVQKRAAGEEFPTLAVPWRPPASKAAKV